MSRRCGMILVVAATVLTVSIAQADVFKMPTGQTNLLTVPVGDAGNAAAEIANEPALSYGSVAHKFHMGKYDVTNAQYCQFLNAKAASSDHYRLWNDKMSTATEGGITRSGNGPYQYSVKQGRGNQPVVFVSWYDAIRFANWLTNGQGNGDTESGTYKITGSGPDWTVSELALDADVRNRIVAVARTIANLDQSERIDSRHVCEAINYRALGR